jgi:hypothetical protein
MGRLLYFVMPYAQGWRIATDGAGWVFASKPEAREQAVLQARRQWEEAGRASGIRIYNTEGRVIESQDFGDCEEPDQL